MKYGDTKLFDGKYTIEQLWQNIVAMNEETIEIPKKWLLEIIVMAQQSDILKKHWLDLCDKILAEHDKDGWCRLIMTKEEALEMKELFQSLD